MCQERIQLNEFIKQYSVDVNEHPRILWHMVYSMAEDLLARKLGRAVSLVEEAKKHNMGRMDYLEYKGFMPEVYAGARELFRRTA